MAKLQATGKKSEPPGGAGGSGVGVGGKQPEDQSLGRLATATAFRGLSLEAALNRIKIMQRTKLAITTPVSPLCDRRSSRTSHSRH